MTANSENSNSINLEAVDPLVAEANRVLISTGGSAANPARGLPMLRAAVQQGSGGAAERLAVMAAMGVGQPADWAAAMNWLVKGAELGHQRSREQLAVLVGLDNAPVDISSWPEFARRIDLKGLLRAPSLKEIRAEPSIALVEGMATGPMCRWLMRRGAARVEPAKVGDYATGEWVLDPIRTGLAAGFGMADTDIVLVMTQKRLELASGLTVRQQESPYILSYAPGQEYKAHYDFLLPDDPAFAHVLAAMGQRVATCLTWLNDDYDGGETAFLKLPWQHKGKPGDAMLFLNVRRTDKKPDPLTLHAGLPVTRGRKWMLSQWVRDKPQPIV